MKAKMAPITMSPRELILFVLLLYGVPRRDDHSYGYGRSGLAGVMLIIIFVQLLNGRL